MKLLSLLAALFAIYICSYGQNIGIGTPTPHASAALEIKASAKGLLIPRTSTNSRMAIISPARGLMLYDSTTSSFWFYNGSIWKEFSAGSNGWNLTGNTGTDTALTHGPCMGFAMQTLWCPW